MQSNFNSDNCLVSGRTFDYGPFGFIERYRPDFGMWVGSGDHFAFMNQPRAAQMNFLTLSESLEPLVDAAGARRLRELRKGFTSDAAARVAAVFAWKLGCAPANATAIWTGLEKLLRAHPADYTRFFRLLPRALGDGFSALAEAFFDASTAEGSTDASAAAAWDAWLDQWRAAVRETGFPASCTA